MILYIKEIPIASIVLKTNIKVLIIRSSEKHSIFLSNTARKKTIGY